MVTDQERHLVERLRKVAPVREKRMFGGLGLYSGELFFALIANDVLYFKTDEANRAAYTSRGLAAFRPFPDRPATLAYHEVPADMIDDPRRLRPWVEGALAAARAAKERSPSKRARSRGSASAARAAPSTKAPSAKKPSAKKPSRKATPARIQNLGPVSMRWLALVGVHTEAELRARGSVAVYRELRARGMPSAANLLYAMEGALMGLRWDRVPDVVKQNLRERAGIDPVR